MEPYLLWRLPCQRVLTRFFVACSSSRRGVAQSKQAIAETQHATSSLCLSTQRLFLPSITKFLSDPLLQASYSAQDEADQQSCAQRQEIAHDDANGNEIIVEQRCASGSWPCSDRHAMVSHVEPDIARKERL